MRPFHCSRISANTRPRDGGLLADRCRCGCAARRCRARRRSAARSPCAWRTSSARPVRLAVRHHGHARAHERAVRVRRARPDVALVDVGVHVDEARQHDAVVEIEARQAVVRQLPGRWRRCAPCRSRCRRARGRRRRASVARRRPRGTPARAHWRGDSGDVRRDGEEVSGHCCLLVPGMASGASRPAASRPVDASGHRPFTRLAG